MFLNKDLYKKDNNISKKSDSQWRKTRMRIILLILSNIKVPGTITIFCCQIFLSSVQKHQTLEVQKTMNVRKSHFCRLNYWRRKWLKFSNFSKIQYLFCTRKGKSKRQFLKLIFIFKWKRNNFLLIFTVTFKSTS